MKSSQPKFASNPNSDMVLHALTLEELNEEFTLARLSLMDMEEGSEEHAEREAFLETVNDFRIEAIGISEFA
tara:strand:- start:1625 stop:1840 length:216 start_codon:yes stop_codon:yes gene_type:complete